MKDIKRIAYRDTETTQVQKRIVELDTAKRHVIKVNGIEAKSNQYEDTTPFRTRELVNVPVDSIALFCSEHIPAHFYDKKYVTYIMTVNGEDHEIEPINSHRPGKKIIRYSDLGADQNHTIYLEESIKSAQLKIIIRSHGRMETPYLSDIKILYGRRINGDAGI